MESASDLNGAIEQLLSQQSGYWLAAGGATLLFYDWLLCLDREVRYICRARWSVAKVLFICHRYAMMALVVIMVYGSVKSSSEPLSPEWCRSWDRVNYIGTPVIVAAIQGTFVLRVCAIYRNSPYIIAFLGTIYLACNAAMLLLASKVLKAVTYLPNPFTSYHFCVRACDGCIRWSGTTYVPLIVIDAVILALTVRRSFVARSQRKAAPILVTLFQDGITYFLVAFAAALVHILFIFIGQGMMKIWMVNYVRPVLSSMATRLLLNLHEQVSRTAHYSTDPLTTMNENDTNAFSAVEFASFTGARDVESVAYDVNGLDLGGQTGGHGDEGRGFELETLRESGREELRSGSGWVELEGRLSAPGRGPRETTNVDPG